MSKIDFLKKGFEIGGGKKSKNLTDINKESYKKKKESKTLEKNAKKKQKELNRKDKKALHSKKKVKLNKSKKTLVGKKPYKWSEKTKSENEENKETYIQLHVESDQSFKELLLDIYFDENAPNLYTNENKIRWRPTADEMDSILEAFDILSQSSVSLEKKIDELSKEFYFNAEKIVVEPPTSDLEQGEIDISPVSGDVFSKEQVQSSENSKKNPEDRTLVNMEKKTDDLSESDKLSDVFITPHKKSTETEEIFLGSKRLEEKGGDTRGDTITNNFEEKTDDLSESDKLSEVFKISSDESPKIEEVVSNPEKIEVEVPISDSEQEEIDKSPVSGDVFSKEQEQVSEDLKENMEDTTTNNFEEKTDDLSESDKLSEVFKISSDESPKIEEVVFNPEKIEVEVPISDSEQEEICDRPRLDKVLFRRVEKT